MKNDFTKNGFTLIELMITVAVIGIIAAIAVPSYQAYVDSNKADEPKAYARMLAAFEETYFYENESYLAGDYEPGVTDTLTTKLAWTPDSKGQKYKYNVAACATGTIDNCFTVTVTSIDDSSFNYVLVRQP